MNLKDYIASNLNEEQTLAALHTKTSSLIIAGAGSGKTRVLTYKIAYLIRGLQLPVQRILAVTFTNKAANEMKERLIKLGDEILSQNFDQGKQQEKADSDDLSDFLSEMQSSAKIQKGLEARELKWIGTFHSIFLKILKEDIEALGRKFTKNFGILDSDDSSKIIRDLLKRFALNDTFKPQEVKGFISTQKNNGNTAELFLKHANGNYEASMGKLYQEYEKELEKANSLDFDDLLLLPYLLFKQDEEILKKWQNAFDYILVDEAQDTNWIQFELMKLMSCESSITELRPAGGLVESKNVKVFSLDFSYRDVHDIKYGNQRLDESSEGGSLESMKVEIGQRIVKFVEEYKLQDYTFVPISSTQGAFLRDILLENEISLADLLEINPSLIDCTKSIDKKGLERKRFASEKYYFKDISLLPKKIILIDDIYQTGSTCDAICEKIFGLDADVEIIFLCLCVVK